MSYSNFELLEVARAGGEHKGLFARVPISAGTLLGIYDGRACIADLGEDGRGAGLDQFFWQQSMHLRRDGRILYYLIPFDEIDGIDYLNHSCRPNARIEDQIYLFALTDILPGEEITADYRSFDLVAQNIPCWCDEPRCII